MKSRADTPRFRKRRGVKAQTDLSARSGRLRRIRDTVQQGDAATGLAAVEEMLVKEALPAETQGQVLCLAADSEFKRGAFEEAAEIHASAAALCARDPILWLRPRIGQVRALLKAAQIEEAWEMARQTLAEAGQKWTDFNAGARQVKTMLKRGKRIQVSPRPQRLSVVAGELGRLFLREGEIDAAKEFLHAAIDACPKGATRARESLAEIALREGDPQTALEWAMQALMTGRLQAKTLHTLRLLVQIKRQLGDPAVSPEILALVRTAQPSISARATLLLAQELRAAGANAQWRQIVHDWLPRNERRFPAEAAEMRKIILRECKQNAGDPRTSLDAAQDVLAQPGLSPMEWLSAAKELARSSWWAGQDPGLDTLVAQARQRGGDDYAHQVAHSLALSTMMAKRHDIAIPWLEAQRARMTPGTPAWGKATWALAVACADTAQPGRAAAYYDQFAKQESHPLNLRAQARLRWVRKLVETGDTQALAAGMAEINALLPAIDDWSTLLDIARQLCHVSGADARQAANAYFDKAEKLALEAIHTAEHPTVAAGILLKLARRTTYDFSRPENTVKVWEDLGEPKRQWLWSERADFWEWVSIVLLSYLRSGKISQADALHAHLGNDSGTPQSGRLMLLIIHGDWAMRSGGPAARQTGLALLSQALDLDPSHDWCRHAHYWWAMEYWKAGDHAAAKTHAIKVRIPAWNTTGMLEDWEMAAQAEWILADGDETKLDAKMVTKFGDKLKQVKLH